MERIKNKKDDLTQKIRPGTTWVSGFTQPGNNDDLRAIDPEGAEMRFIPASRYYASTTIKRGQAISIAQLTDLTDEQRQNKFAYVKVTDPDIDETCIGIAMNYAEEGQIVQIQNTGKFNFYTTNSVLYTKENAAKEIFLNSDGWNFDNVRGQRLFIKKLYNNATNSGSTVVADDNGDTHDTDHPDRDSKADETSYFTYDFVDSIYNVKNTIQLGYLTDAPTTPKATYIREDGVWYQQITDSEGNVTKKEINKDVVIVEKVIKELEVKKDVSGGDISLDIQKVTKEVVVTKEDITLSSTGITIPAGSTPPKAHEAIWVQVSADNENEYVAVDDLVVTIELDITGDTRGPIDNTQFLVTLGESIYFDSKKQDVELNKPHYNDGVFDEIKVLSIAEGAPSAPSFRLFLTVSGVNKVDNKLDYGFIAVRRLDGDTYIIPTLCDFTKEDLDSGALTDVNDEGYYKLSQEFTAGVERTYIENGEEVKRAPRIIVSDESIGTLDRETVKAALTKAMQSIFMDEDTFEIGCNVVTENIGDDGFLLTTKELGGYYDIYLSSNLYSLVSVTQIEHGRAAEAGTAILADIRDAGRLNVAGVVLSNQSGIHKKGEIVKVMRMGRIVTLGNLQPGLQYFLGLNGRITAREQYWYDHNVPIGIAESANYFIVDISQFPLHDYSGNFPLGYIKPSVYGRAEKGFVLTDGVTVYAKEEYPELYNMLLNWFSEDELRPSKVTETDYNRYKTTSLSEIFDDILAKLAILESNIEDISKKDTEQIQQATNTINTFVSDQTAKEAELDQAAAEAETAAEEAKQVTTALQSDVAQNKADIATINTEIENLKAADTSIKSDVTSHAQSIGTLLSDNSNQKAQISSLDQNVSNLQVTVSDLTENKDTANKNISSLQTKVEQLQETITTLQSSNSNLEKQLSTANINITTLTATVEQLQQQVAALQASQSGSNEG